ncbi:hypothetical protein HAX54_029408, partial [Datura stramonium]|nr:hypothetical protein [Datura stramonium]
VVHDKCGMEKEKEENPSVDVIGDRNVKLLTFKMWLKHKLNSGEVEKKRRRIEFEKPPKRRRKCLRVS